MPLKLYNTLTRQKEDFTPRISGKVGMYVCGPTVYGHSHIGHAKSYVSFDVILRYLRYLKYKVLYIQNITDVGHLTDDADEGEDKIEKRSKLDKIHPMQIVEQYTRSYFEDMDAMGIIRPDISPRATGHIIEQIEMVKDLIQKGYAYAVNGSVYFDVSKDKEYGKLSHRDTEELEAGTRIDVKSEKRHPNDFALWKKAEEGHIMQWQSPWGMGFPGWHVECSAMSMKYLGESFDIHGGGMDNQFPHHECEIAQSECATGKPFVKYWLHNNLVTVGGQKMGKSLGNVILLKDAFKKFSPVVVRFFILQSHYRGTLDFTDEALDGAGKGLEKLLNTIRNIRQEINKAPAGVPNGGKSLDLAKFKTAFLEAMDDDFNTPMAIGVLFDAAREMNTRLAARKLTAAELSSANDFFNELGGTIMGIIPDEGDAGVGGKALIENDLMNIIIDLRADARKQKLFSFSDKIRDGLAKIGIVVEDKKDGTSWRRT
ncbi:MAG: cysteine--tRNA ligase [Bacteroidota bacterium]